MRIPQGCKVKNANDNESIDGDGLASGSEVDVVIEVPRGSLIKRGSTGRVDFISPLPCPFNYGSVPAYIGLEGDLLDALVLGPRLPLGAQIRVKAWGAMILTDRGMTDDKLICSNHRVTAAERRMVLGFLTSMQRARGC